MTINNNQTVINFLKSDEVFNEFKKYKINNLYLFGSYARGDNKKNSDLDLLIDYDRAKKKITLFDLVNIENYFKKHIGINRVDIVTKKAINTRLKKSIENDLIKIF